MKHKKLIVAFSLVFILTMLSTFLVENTSWAYGDIVICFALIAIWYSGNIYWKTLVDSRYLRLLWLLCYLAAFVSSVVTSFGHHILGWNNATHHFSCLTPAPFIVIFLLSKLPKTNPTSDIVG